jgi:hypothetical protein
MGKIKKRLNKDRKSIYIRASTPISFGNGERHQYGYS